MPQSSTMSLMVIWFKGRWFKSFKNEAMMAFRVKEATKTAPFVLDLKISIAYFGEKKENRLKILAIF